MKNFKTFAVAALLAVSATASAQFTNSSSASSSSSANAEGWNTIWVEYNPSSFKYDVKGADNQSFNGFSFGYSRAFSLTPSTPLFLEAGFGVQYSFFSETEEGDDDGDWGYDVKTKFNMFSAKIPVNIMYNFQLPNSKISLIPYLGLGLRFNLSAKTKVTAEYWGDLPSYIDEDDEDNERECNMFDKEDMDGSENTWKRFQIGWQIGLKARFADKFLVGVSYGSDFSEIAKKTKIGGASITLGYTF